MKQKWCASNNVASLLPHLSPRSAIRLCTGLLDMGALEWLNYLSEKEP